MQLKEDRTRRGISKGTWTLTGMSAAHLEKLRQLVHTAALADPEETDHFLLTLDLTLWWRTQDNG